MSENPKNEEELHSCRDSDTSENSCTLKKGRHSRKNTSRMISFRRDTAEGIDITGTGDEPNFTFRKRRDTAEGIDITGSDEPGFTFKKKTSIRRSAPLFYNQQQNRLTDYMRNHNKADNTTTSCLELEPGQPSESQHIQPHGRQTENRWGREIGGVEFDEKDEEYALAVDVVVSREMDTDNKASATQRDTPVLQSTALLVLFNFIFLEIGNIHHRQVASCVSFPWAMSLAMGLQLCRLVVSERASYVAIFGLLSLFNMWLVYIANKDHIFFGLEYFIGGLLIYTQKSGGTASLWKPSALFSLSYVLGIVAVSLGSRKRVSPFLIEKTEIEWGKEGGVVVAMLLAGWLLHVQVCAIHAVSTQKHLPSATRQDALARHKSVVSIVEPKACDMPASSPTPSISNYMKLGLQPCTSFASKNSETSLGSSNFKKEKTTANLSENEAPQSKDNDEKMYLSQQQPHSLDGGPTESLRRGTTMSATTGNHLNEQISLPGSVGDPEPKKERECRKKSHITELDLESPTTRIIETLQELIEYENLDGSVVVQLRMIMKLLASTMRTADFLIKDNQEEMDDSIEKWLVNVLNVTPQSCSKDDALPDNCDNDNDNDTDTDKPVSRKGKQVMTFADVDDTTPEVENMLTTCNTIEFNIFQFTIVANNRPLYHLILYVFHKENFIQHFKLDVPSLKKFLVQVENGYRWKNSYHNHMHAADVAQFAYYLLHQGDMRSFLTPLERMSLLIAASVHDFDHPGVNNNFLCAADDPLAILYNDKAVLENHHCASAFQLMRMDECDFFQNNSKDSYRRLREIVCHSVLATDATTHFETNGKFKSLMAVGVDRKSKTDRLTVCTFLMKCSDTSNAYRELSIAQQWTSRLMMEFFHQGDLERQRGLPLSAWMNREDTDVAKLQTSFIDYFVAPMTDGLIMLMDIPKLIHNVKNNRVYWDSRHGRTVDVNHEVAIAVVPSNWEKQSTSNGANKIMGLRQSLAEFFDSDRSPKAPVTKQFAQQVVCKEQEVSKLDEILFNTS